MPWTFEYHQKFLQEYKAFPKWRRKVLRDKVKAIKLAEDPLLLASTSGSIARFSMLLVGSLIIGRVDLLRCHLIFLKIQAQ